MSNISKMAASVPSLKNISYNPKVGKWRTEAMRSHGSGRLLIVSKGHGRITVSGLTKGFGPNNLIYIPPRTMYGYEAGSTVFGQMLTIPTAMNAEWPDENVHLRLRDVAAQKELATLLDGLERELDHTNALQSRAAFYHLGLISVFFERQIDSNEAIDPQTETTAARLVAAYSDLIERGFRDSDGVADYAARLGVTPTHLTRCCKRTCGRSALDLLNDRRHFEACFMLQETPTAVQDIAVALGYSSAAYFSRAFQNRSGCSPSTFRKQGASAKQRDKTTASRGI